MTIAAEAAAAPGPRTRQVVYRHGLAVRVTHWINVLAVTLLLLSGLNILNAHPRLYWGRFGADFDTPWFETGASGPAAQPVGVTRIGGLEFRTTGVLGASKAADGAWHVQGFPDWLTFPGYRDLATARRWHFFFAWLFVLNGLAYWLSGFVSGHLKRDLAPTGDDLKPRNIWRSIVDHIRLRHPVGEAAKRYNVLQKFAYLAVIAALLPVVALTGMTMSPGIDAALPWLVDLFGGRQSARSIHFITANLIVLFVLIHLIEVVLAGVWNELRSMITGRYAVPAETHR